MSAGPPANRAPPIHAGETHDLQAGSSSECFLRRLRSQRLCARTTFTGASRHDGADTMTFLHKLARRLARLKDLTPIAVAAVSLAAAIMGCEQAGTSTQPITPTISQLIVSPKAVTLQPDQLQDFMAVGLLSTGDTAQVDVTWSTSGGSVSA